MTTINFLYQQAELAFASYASLTSGPTSNQAQRDNLEEQGFSEKQAQEFASRYPEVVTQFNDTDTSFSATVFKDTSGNLTLAIRGTLEFGDFIPTDTFISGQGAAYDQIVAMYNWWLRVSTPAGQSVNQFRFTAGPNGFIEPAPDAISTGEVVGNLTADTDGKVDVTGHSLGAHLSLAFNTIFSNDTNNVTAFNTPGFINNSTNQQFFAALGGQVPVANNSSNVINVFASEANVGEPPWNAIAELHFEDNPTGEVITLSIEDQAGLNSDEPFFQRPGARNHSQMILTDSLAVYNLLNQLAPTLSATDYKTILNESTIGTSASYERIVDALETLFGVNNTLLPSGNNKRDDLYTAIYGLQSKPEFQSFSGQLQITPLRESDPATKFKVRALGLDLDNPADAIAYRYALVNLNPFVITGNDGLYIDHNQNGELDLYDAETGLGLTNEYIEARSSYLQLVMERNLNDYTNEHGYATTKTALTSESRIYHDYENNILIAPDDSSLINRPDDDPLIERVIFGFNNETPDLLLGADRNDHLFGQKGNDVLVGGDGEDWLEGNDDNDILLGGLISVTGQVVDDSTKDTLKGGEGHDTYHAGFGDVIEDSDGEGTVYFRGELLTSGLRYSDETANVYKSVDGQFTYTLNPDTNTLTVTSLNAAGAPLIINNYTSGTLGITLQELTLGTGGTLTLNGDDNEAPHAVWQRENSDPDDDVHFGNYSRVEGLGGDDVLGSPDFAAGFQLLGGAGHDVLFGDDDESGNYFQAVLDGDPLPALPSPVAAGVFIDGESGNDFIQGSFRADVIKGGADNNYLSGYFGNDVLIGGSQSDVLHGEEGNDPLAGGVWIDTLVDSSGNDTWRVAV